MSNYLYIGPPTSVTLAGGAEINLAPQKAVEVDCSLPYFRRLIARGLLKAIPAPKGAERTETGGTGGCGGSAASAPETTNETTKRSRR